MSYLGTTPPLSIDPPTPKELECTEKLIQVLHDLNLFETEDESKRREIVLTKLNILVKDFVKKVALLRNLPETVANEAGGKIFTFGSYRLGVHGAGADIDTLCVVPRFVQREDFFSEFYEILKNNPEVTELNPVPDSYVPLIKMCYDTIPIDLLFARLNLSSISDNLELRSDQLLKNLDERCVRSLNGSRVTDEILRLVPDIQNFRITLRCIKLWAKKKAIYSNIMGFPGGVAWAMMVARVCQLYPKATASVLVTKFFEIIGRWQWPKPILLKNIEEGPLNFRVWNPITYPADKSHRMPVITPAYPSMCATHNVTSSTLKIIIEELNRAAEISKSILQHGDWLQLFRDHDFFSRYKYYLQVIPSSDSLDTQRMWSSFVESKLRHLVLKLEVVDSVLLAHPFVKGFEKETVCYSEEATAVARGSNNLPQRENIDNENLEKESKTIFTTTFYIGLQIDRSALKSGPNSKRLDISYPTNEFTKICKLWESYDEKKMGICVKYIKSTVLPNDVFEDEPQKQLKRAKALDLEQPIKKAKNSFDATCNDNSLSESISEQSLAS